ncbi:hypothetical protein [Halomonas sp. MMSF_3323]|uniref:hypothetical protein n=1 Tax=Halomonas sp. MMSF_3323 TaxID=3046701 RepID=UPI00273FA343|nr:hypothetical protein [Halomonas sp. MMSF_3323]
MNYLIKLLKSVLSTKPAGRASRFAAPVGAAPCEEGVFYRIEALRQGFLFSPCKRCLQDPRESEASLARILRCRPGDSDRVASTLPISRCPSSGEFFEDLKKPFQNNHFYHSLPPVTFARRRQRMRTLRIGAGLGKHFV